VKVIITVARAKPAQYGLRILPAFSVLLAGVLLASNLPFVPGRMHAYLSAAPLALAGIGYAALQIRARPARPTLWKRLLLAATFILWAVGQLLPAGRMATVVGDVVIAAYVLDLYWLVQEQTDGGLE
jgi:hypothetical protein